MTKYAIVPVEPTSEKHIETLCDFTMEAGSNPRRKKARAKFAKARWSAMLAASPPSDQIAVPRELLAEIVSALKQSGWDAFAADVDALLSPTATGEESK